MSKKISTSRVQYHHARFLESEMMPLINDTGEVRELTQRDLKQFKPAQEVLPENLLKKLNNKAKSGMLEEICHENEN